MVTPRGGYARSAPPSAEEVAQTAVLVASLPILFTLVLSSAALLLSLRKDCAAKNVQIDKDGTILKVEILINGSWIVNEVLLERINLLDAVEVYNLGQKVSITIKK